MSNKNFISRVNNLREKGEMDFCEKLKIMGECFEKSGLQKGEVADAIAQAILRELFAYPNCQHPYTKAAISFVSREKFFSNCSKENQEKINRLLDYCSFKNSHGVYPVS